MANDYSDSDDEDRRRSKRKSKSKRYSRLNCWSCPTMSRMCCSRSRSASKDRDRVQKSKKSSKHKRRSGSRSITSEKRSRRRSHSRSVEKSRRRSRSRSSEYSSRKRGHRRSRSGSRRSRSHSRSDHDSRKSSRSRDSHKSFSSKPAEQSKDTKNNAQLAEKKLQKALKAAITADDILRAQGVQISSLQAKTGQLSFEEQKNRASAINDIESGDFVQEAFKSSRSEIPLPLGSSIDASHAGAMFSSGPSAKLPATSNAPSHGACVLPSNTNSVMHPNLYIGVEEKMERWKQKVIELRRQKIAVS